MGRDLPVRGDDDPFPFVRADESFDDKVGLVSQPRVNDRYPGDCRLFFSVTARLPAVENDGYIVPSDPAVFGQVADQPGSFRLKIAMPESDQIVAVNNERRNNFTSQRNMLTVYPAAPEKLKLPVPAAPAA